MALTTTFGEKLASEEGLYRILDSTRSFVPATDPELALVVENLSQCFNVLQSHAALRTTRILKAWTALAVDSPHPAIRTMARRQNFGKLPLSERLSVFFEQDDLSALLVTLAHADAQSPNAAHVRAAAVLFKEMQEDALQFTRRFILSDKLTP